MKVKHHIYSRTDIYIGIENEGGTEEDLVFLSLTVQNASSIKCIKLE